MMQEVVGDDTNGESTFEFVEGGGQPSEITGSIASEQLPPADNLTTNVPAGSGILVAPLPDVGPSSQPYSSVPPPLALPSFLSPSANVQASSASTAIVPPPQRTFPSTVPSTLVASQPMYSQPPSTTAGISPLIYTPMRQSTTVELPAMDYSSGFSTVSPATLNKTDTAGMWGWIKGTVSGNDFLHKVAEKAKNSVGSVITTLDPQMKDYMYSGGDIDIIVASDKEDKVGSIREAFQAVFGRATVSGMATQTNIAVQPVGHSAGLKGAEDRISYLRQSGQIHERQPLVAIENFVVELTPDRWFDIGCLVLDDPAIESPLHVYTQSTPVPVEYISEMQKDTPPDYPLRWSGLAVPVGSVVSRAILVPHTEWHAHIAGVPRRDIILMAARSLATAYKNSRNRVMVLAPPIWQ